MSSQGDKAAVFRALHAGEAFVIPNPWDAGSARVLAALGFKALATTSSGFAFDHVATLDRATDLPVSVDLENGWLHLTTSRRASSRSRFSPGRRTVIRK